MTDQGLEKEKFEILIVEDSPTQAEELKHTLERQGFAVKSACNGVEALAKIREKRPTMVISDIVMPEMDGYRLCREIKGDGALRDIPVILLTALSDPRDVVRGLECGADNFITKPYDEKYILSRLRYILANMHLKDVEKTQLGVEVILAGEKYFIKSDRIQILNLLLSSYDAAVRKNGELAGARDELMALSDQLEQKVKERTAALSDEITERKRTEEALSREKALLRCLIDSVGDFIFIKDRDGFYRGCNKASEKFIGLPECEQIGKTDFDFFDREMAEEIQKIDREVLDGGKPNRIQDWVPDRDGDTLFLDTLKTPYYGPDGEVLGLVGISRDITELKRMEQALSAKEREYQTLVDNIPDYIVRYDPELRRTYVNPAWEKASGLSANEVINVHAEDIPRVPKPAIPEYLDNIRKTFETGIPQKIEFTWVNLQGVELYLDYKIVPEYDRNGNIASVLAVGHDITERKKAEEAVRHANDYNRCLIEASIDPFVTIGHDGRITDVNSATEKVTGVPREGLIGRDFSDFFTDQKRAKAGYQLVFNEGSVRDYELEIRHANGHTTPVLYNASVYRDEKGEVAGMFAAARDMSERRRLEEQLRQAQKMEAIGQLAGGIAHDFNNILMTIIGFGTILKMKLDERDPIQSDIDHILAASDRAANLTRSMLAYGRKQFMNPKTVDLNDIAKNGEKLLRRVIGEDLELISTYADKPLKVFADSVQIEQVLMNLATNARDAMPDGGTLSLHTESVEIEDRFLNINECAKKGLYAVLSFSDTGIGMDKGTVDMIFDPFFTTKEVGKGTGLGLSMVYGIVRQHDGFITCYSEPGKGTTFRIYLPIFHGEVGEGPPLQDVQMSRGRETILLAEDDPASRSVSRRYLENFGYTVIEATDGEEAVEKFIEHREKINLALLDVIMPKMNGREAYRRIKEMEPDAKVIFMSGYTADFIYKREFLEEGLTFLSKPTMLRELPVKIREILDS
jgi:two-component system cell cycle sensor histidine kinase/response regulator CckA